MPFQHEEVPLACKTFPTSAAHAETHRKHRSPAAAARGAAGQTQARAPGVTCALSARKQRPERPAVVQAGAGRQRVNGAQGPRPGRAPVTGISRGGAGNPRGTCRLPLASARRPAPPAAYLAFQPALAGGGHEGGGCPGTWGPPPPAGRQVPGWARSLTPWAPQAFAGATQGAPLGSWPRAALSSLRPRRPDHQALQPVLMGRLRLCWLLDRNPQSVRRPLSRGSSLSQGRLGGG